MSFGLQGVSSSFQQVMDKALQGVRDCAVAYIDDILIFSPTWEDHLAHLQKVLHALREAGLMVNQKSHIRCISIQY